MKCISNVSIIRGHFAQSLIIRDLISTFHLTSQPNSKPTRRSPLPKSRQRPKPQRGFRLCGSSLEGVCHSTMSISYLYRPRTSSIMGPHHVAILLIRAQGLHDRMKSCNCRVIPLESLEAQVASSVGRRCANPCCEIVHSHCGRERASVGFSNLDDQADTRIDQLTGGTSS